MGIGDGKRMKYQRRNIDSTPSVYYRKCKVGVIGNRVIAERKMKMAYLTILHILMEVGALLHAVIFFVPFEDMGKLNHGR